jgi:hypothetical protein
MEFALLIPHVLVMHQIDPHLRELSLHIIPEPWSPLRLADGRDRLDVVNAQFNAVAHLFPMRREVAGAPGSRGGYAVPMLY